MLLSSMLLHVLRADTRGWHTPPNKWRMLRRIWIKHETFVHFFSADDVDDDDNDDDDDHNNIIIVSVHRYIGGNRPR